MEKIQALAALGALSQNTRLDAFRALVKAAPDGMLAGEICAALDVRANTLSTNLAVLLNAGLVTNQREGRGVRYFADMSGMQGLLTFLMEDCCGGQPEACRPVLDTLSCPS